MRSIIGVGEDERADRQPVQGLRQDLTFRIAALNADVERQRPFEMRPQRMEQHPFGIAEGGLRGAIDQADVALPSARFADMHTQRMSDAEGAHHPLVEFALFEFLRRDDILQRDDVAWSDERLPHRIEMTERRRQFQRGRDIHAARQFGILRGDDERFHAGFRKFERDRRSLASGPGSQGVKEGQPGFVFQRALVDEFDQFVGWRDKGVWFFLRHLRGPGDRHCHRAWRCGHHAALIVMRHPPLAKAPIEVTAYDSLRPPGGAGKDHMEGPSMRGILRVGGWFEASSRVRRNGVSDRARMNNRWAHMGPRRRKRRG